MGKLIDQERRARARGAKKERCERILEAAAGCFLQQPFADVTLDGVGQRAKVRQGLPTLYFGSKEELFLALVKREIERWSAALTERLAERDRYEPSDLARVLVDSLAERPLLTRLLSLVTAVLEQNMDVSAALSFGEWRRRRFSALGEALQRCCPAVREDGGAAFMRRLTMLVAAVDPLASPRGVAALSSWGDDEGHGKVDLRDELGFLIERILG